MHIDSTSNLAQLDALLKARLFNPANTIDDERAAWSVIVDVKRRLEVAEDVDRAAALMLERLAVAESGLHLAGVAHVD